jgi:hypothetical protein
MAVIHMLAVCAGVTWRHRHENADDKLVAEIWGAAIVAGGAIIGGVMQNNAAGKAASAQQSAANAAIAQQELNYNRTQTNLQPYMDAGTNALSLMNQANSGDYSAFNNSPDYQFALQQGLGGLDRSAAAKGSLYSGGHSADLLNYASGLASQNYGNWYNRLAGLSSQGQAAASNLGSIGNGQAAAIGGYLTNAGNANANAAINQGNQNANTIGQIGNVIGNYLGGQQGAQNASSYAPPASANVLGGGMFTGGGSTSTYWPGQ